MSRHIKRLAQPRRWKLPKKVATWGPKPTPGPHAQDDALPVVVALRDLLGVADTATEAERIVGSGMLHVDGRPCRDPRRGLGFMDVVTVPEAEVAYRVIYDRHGRIALAEIDADEAESKLVRIEDKTTVTGGRRQLNLHDGRNLVVKEDTYGTGDVLRIKVPSQEIAAHFPFQEGAPATVTGGAHIGEIAQIQGKQVVPSSSPNLVQLENEAEFQTIEDYVFVVGEDEPAIDFPEVELHG